MQGSQNTHLKGKNCGEHCYSAASTVGPEASRMFSSAPRVGFARSLRPVLGKVPTQWSVPGPGQYVSKEKYTRGIRCVFLVFPQPCQLSGPGQYVNKEKYTRGIRCGFFFCPQACQLSRPGQYASAEQYRLGMQCSFGLFRVLQA